MSIPRKVDPNRKVRVTANIDFQLHLLFKLACKEMGVSMESRIEHLLKEDMKQSLKKEWFKGLAPSGKNGLGNQKWKALNFATIKTQ